MPPRMSFAEAGDDDGRAETFESRKRLELVKVLKWREMAQHKPQSGSLGGRLLAGMNAAKRKLLGFD